MEQGELTTLVGIGAELARVRPRVARAVLEDRLELEAATVLCEALDLLPSSGDEAEEELVARACAMTVDELDEFVDDLIDAAGSGLTAEPDLPVVARPLPAPEGAAQPCASEPSAADAITPVIRRHRNTIECAGQPSHRAGERSAPTSGPPGRRSIRAARRRADSRATPVGMSGSTEVHPVRAGLRVDLRPRRAPSGRGPPRRGPGRRFRTSRPATARSPTTSPSHTSPGTSGSSSRARRSGPAGSGGRRGRDRRRAHRLGSPRPCRSAHSRELDRDAARDSPRTEASDENSGRAHA